MIPKISTIPIQQLAYGDCLSIQVYKFIGAKPGKKAYLQSNLHGAEIVGNAVIYQLIEFFRKLDDTQLQGEIWLVPACNPLGTNQRHHFFSVLDRKTGDIFADIITFELPNDAFKTVFL